MDGRFTDRARATRVQAVLDATLKVLEESGYDRFRVEDVARRVGIAKGTVYLDFPGKQQLIDSAIEWASEQLVRKAADGIVGISDPLLRYTGAVRTLAHAAVEHPEWAVMLEARSVHGAAGGESPPCAVVRAYLESLLRQAKAAKALLGAQNEVTAEALLGLLSRPAWRRVAAEEGTETALRRSGFDEVLSRA